MQGDTWAGGLFSFVFQALLASFIVNLIEAFVSGGVKRGLRGKGGRD